MDKTEILTVDMSWLLFIVIIVTCIQYASTNQSVFVCPPMASTYTGPIVGIKGEVKAGEDWKLRCLCVVRLPLSSDQITISRTPNTYLTGDGYGLKFTHNSIVTTYTSTNYSTRSFTRTSGGELLFVKLVKGTNNTGEFKFNIEIFTHEGTVNVTCVRNFFTFTRPPQTRKTAATTVSTELTTFKPPDKTSIKSPTKPTPVPQQGDTSLIPVIIGSCVGITVFIISCLVIGFVILLRRRERLVNGDKDGKKPVLTTTHAPVYENTFNNASSG